MIDPTGAGVTEADWARETGSCHALRVERVIQETHDARSLVLEVPENLAERFRYRAGQFLSFKIPYQSRVLVRSYSLSSSPDCDSEHKVTIKRIETGRISNWMNDHVAAGDNLMVTPPAGFFTLREEERRLFLFAGGSGITPCISLIKTALVTTRRAIKLFYANRDRRSIIFHDELEELAARHPDRLEIVHSLDDSDGFLHVAGVESQADADPGAAFYLCGPSAFMDVVERGLARLGVDAGQIHVERFVSPPDPGEAGAAAAEPAAADGDVVPERITVVLDGETHEVPYRAGLKVLEAAREAGLDPPFSCEEGYCSCCMAKLTAGTVRMDANDCLTPELLAEGWVLTCQSRCVGRKIRIEYPD